MNFRIAYTFTDSLAKLMGEEQKAVTTTFGFQLAISNFALKMLVTRQSSSDKLSLQ